MVSGSQNPEKSGALRAPEVVNAGNSEIWIPKGNLNVQGSTTSKNRGTSRV